MEVEVGGVEVVRQHPVDRYHIRVRRQCVDQLDPQRVAGPDTEGGSRDVAPVSSELKAVAADILVGVAHPKGRRENTNTVRGAPHFRVHKRRMLRVGRGTLIEFAPRLLPCAPAPITPPRDLGSASRPGAASAVPRAAPWSRKRRRDAVCAAGPSPEGSSMAISAYGQAAPVSIQALRSAPSAFCVPGTGSRP